MRFPKTDIIGCLFHFKQAARLRMKHRRLLETVVVITIGLTSNLSLGPTTSPKLNKVLNSNVFLDATSIARQVVSSIEGACESTYLLMSNVVAPEYSTDLRSIFFYSLACTLYG